MEQHRGAGKSLPHDAAVPTTPWHRSPTRARALKYLRAAFATALAVAVSISIWALLSERVISAPAADCPGGTLLLPPSFTITVTLQRPNAPPPDPSWAVPITLGLYPPGDSDTICHEYVLTLTESGTFSGRLGAYTGFYDARVKNMHTLRNVVHDVYVTRTTTIDAGELLEGDANDDNWVKGDDFSILRTSYFKREGETGFDDRADFDEDGWVKGSDFSLLRTNYWMHGDISVDAGEAGLNAQSAANGVTISIVPVSSTVHVSDVFTTAIRVDAAAQPVDAVDADVTFPAESLVVVDASGEPTDRVIPGTALDTELYNSVDNELGRLTYSAGAGFDSTPPTGTFTLATIRLRAQDVLTHGVLDFSEATDVYFEGGSVLDARVDGTVAVTDYHVFLPTVLRETASLGRRSLGRTQPPGR